MTNSGLEMGGTRWTSWLWLVGAGALLPFSNGRFALPLVAWLAPALLLRFLETSRRASGLALGGAVYLGAYFVMWQGMIPAPGALYFAIAGGYGLVYYLPFVLHRLLAGRVWSWAATLVFPLAWVVCEAGLDWLSPYGSWISIAYSQSQSLALAQVAAVAGVVGISFLVTWTSAVTSWILGRWRELPVRGGILVAWACAVGLAVVGGDARLRLAPQPTATVRAAALLPDAARRAALLVAMRPWQGLARPAPAELSQVREKAEALNADLLARTEREAQAGARLVAWSETAGRLLKSEESEFLAQAGEVAARHGLVLFAAYGTWSPGSRPPFENKVAAFDTQGRLAWEFHKARPITGPETPMIAAGDGKIPILETPFGRIAAAICHDLDFPRLILQAGKQGVELLVAPSSDWEEITPFHGRMAILRAVENGFTLLRPSDGLSVAADLRGVVVGQSDSFRSDANVLVVDLPLARRRTLFNRVGFAAPWLAAALLVLVAGSAWRRSSIPAR